MTATLRQLGFKVEFVYGNLDWQLAETRLLSGVRIAFALRYLIINHVKYFFKNLLLFKAKKLLTKDSLKVLLLCRTNVSLKNDKLPKSTSTANSKLMSKEEKTK